MTVKTPPMLYQWYRSPLKLRWKFTSLYLPSMPSDSHTIGTRLNFLI